MKKSLLFLFILTLLVGCMAGASAEKVFKYYMKNDCPVLNQQSSVETSLEVPMTYCGATPYRAVPTDDGLGYHYIPEIASDYPVQIDDVTWQIPLREDACWSNGEPINADTFIYSFKMLLDPLLVNRMAFYLYNNMITIENAEAYYNQGTENSVSWDDVGIKKIDDYTIQITTTMKVKETDVCGHFSTRAIVPVYEPLYEAGMLDDRTSTTYGTNADNWIGCGPYLLETWAQDSVQVYARNENYWMPELFHFDKVEVRIIPDANALEELWQKGELDVYNPDANRLDKYIDDPRTYEYPSLTVFHIDINSSNPNNPLCSSVAYRKALYHAMNREEIARNIFGYQKPSGTYVNEQAGILSESGLTYRKSEPGLAVTELVNSWGPSGYSPELARQYLAQAYEECGLSEDTVITLVMAYDKSDSYWNTTAEYLMEEFPVIFDGKVKIEIHNYSDQTTTDYKKGHNDWDLSPNDWSRGASRTYPYTCFYYYLTSYSGRPNNYVDEEFDAQYAICDSAEVKEDYSRMLEETAKLERIYLDKVIHIPMVQEVNYQMMSDRLELAVEEYVGNIGFALPFADIIE